MKTMGLMIMSTLFLSLGLSAQDNGYEVGDKVNGFELKNIDGSMVSLSDFKDQKGVIVIFMCKHCPYVQAYEDRIVQLDKKYAEKGYPVIGINSNDAEQYPEDSYENMKKQAEKEGFTFPYLVDPTQQVARQFGATRTPHVYLLDQQEGGSFEVAYIGAIDDNVKNPKKVEKRYLEQAIRSLEKGQQPEPAHTKAIGCTIKWKE